MATNVKHIRKECFCYLKNLARYRSENNFVAPSK